MDITEMLDALVQYSIAEGECIQMGEDESKEIWNRKRRHLQEKIIKYVQSLNDRIEYWQLEGMQPE